jgi:methionyl-tRNA synthetase
MSKSRAPAWTRYLSLGMNRNGCATIRRLNAKNEDIDSTPTSLARVNSDLVTSTSPAARLHQRFGGKLGEVSADGAALLDRCAQTTPSPGITKPANTPRPCAKPCC